MAVPNSKSDDALLKNLVPLNTLSDEQLGVLLSRVTVEKAKKGEYLFREGDTDHQNIYLLHGTIALLSGQKEMDLVSSGTQTSRFALAHQLPRKHSAQARTAVTYVRIDSRMLSDMLARSHSASYEVSDIEQPASGDWMSLLLQSPVFQQIPPANLQRVMMRMEEIEVSAGDVIIRQGDEGDYFYLISRGEVSVSRSPEAGHAPVELAKLKVGRGFGEEALISDKPRSSSVTMLSDGVLVRLNKQDFIQLVKQPLSRTLDYKSACEVVEGGALWLDVRTPEEYEAGHLPGAINLPFFSLRFQASSLTMDRPYVVYGDEVGQSATAAYLLTERGAEGFVLELDWVELEAQAGLREAPEEEPPVSNVIDFNRDSDDSAALARRLAETQRQEIDSLQHALEEAKTAYEEELKQRQTEVKLLKQALTVAKERVGDAESQDEAVAQLHQEIDSLRDSLAQAEAQRSEAAGLKRQLEQLQERSGQLDLQVAGLQEELEQTRKLSGEFRQQSVELQIQLKEQQQRREGSEGRLKEEITELRLRLESASDSEKELAQKQQELDQLRAEMTTLEERSEAYRQQAAEDLARLSAERVELESSLQQLQEQQASQLADEQQQLVSLQQSLQDSQASLESAQSEFQQRESSLQAALEASQQESAQALARAEAEIEQLRSQQDELQSALDQSSHKLEEAGGVSEREKAQLQQQVDGLQALLQQQEATREALQQEKAALESQLASSGARANELDNQVQALEEQRQRLERELASLRQAGSDAESQHHSAIASLREELEQARRSVDELHASRQQLGAELQQARDEAQSRQQQLNQALAAIQQENGEEQARLDAALAGLNQELEAARTELRKQRDKRVEMEARLEQELQTAAFLQRSLKTAEEAVEVSDRQYTEAEQARQALESRVGELQQVADELRSGGDGLQQRLQALEQEKSELSAQLEQARAESETAQHQLAETGRTQAEAEQQQTELQRRLQQLQAERDDVLNQSRTGQEALDRAQAELSELRQALAGLQSAAEAAEAERDVEREALQTRVNELEEQAAAQREALSAAQAASEAAVDRGELESAQGALQASRQENESLRREIESLREVQMEMESQLSDDADGEIQQLRAALEAEEQRRRKVEQQAQKADVLRRERDVQETAIEMLNDDLESLVKEKDALAAERDSLAKQLREIRAQYTELVNENDQLHSEMSGFVGQAGESGLADDLLAQVEELRGKADRFEQERDQSRADAARMRREVGELRSVIETYVEQIQDVQSFGADEQVAALRTELDMVRRQAHRDLEHMRMQLQETESRLTGQDDRDVDFVADQQAVRQEMVSLQQALNEKDHLLRLAQSQCRSLEDAVEDRDKEVDQLKRKLELLLRKAGGLDDPSMRLGSRSLSDSQQEVLDGLGGDNDSKQRSGIGRLFRKK